VSFLSSAAAAAAARIVFSGRIEDDPSLVLAYHNEQEAVLQQAQMEAARPENPEILPEKAKKQLVEEL
jgi:hypothetical protein